MLRFKIKVIQRLTFAVIRLGDWLRYDVVDLLDRINDPLLEREDELN